MFEKDRTGEIFYTENIKSVSIIKSKILEITKGKAARWDKDKLIHFLYSVIETRALSLDPDESLKFLFDLENKIYQLEGRESIRYGNGLHTKHGHIKYHDFFIRNILEGSRVLDVGCGNGALAYDIAEKVKRASVYGIDIVPENIKKAEQMFPSDNITYVTGDALRDLPDKQFDVIVLSNVLEHIEKRTDFLKGLKKRYAPSRILLRVPLFERDWRVPLKKELGIDYRLDATHHTEYLQEEFFSELAGAGLDFTHVEFRWGEIWCIAVPVSETKD